MMICYVLFDEIILCSLPLSLSLFFWGGGVGWFAVPYPGKATRISCKGQESTKKIKNKKISGEAKF